MSLSSNTQAILLLTAPLIVGRGERASDQLTQWEYQQLARFLHDKERQPADLLAPDAEELLIECESLMDANRLRRLLARGFLLSQAVERWQTRAIWVASRADAEYPERLKERLKSDAPPVLYGCGDVVILNTGGLAIVGSRQVDEALVEYTEGIGRLTAESGCTVVSGGARGIDQAAMRGALEAGGKVAGIMADSLERAALNRENRIPIMDGRLVLISPYDPAAGFNVGHAMQRNKLIYSLADAALVVNSDYEAGGTWTGAVEQLEKLQLVTVYVRATGKIGQGLEGLQRKGALPWPNPETPETFTEALSRSHDRMSAKAGQSMLNLEIRDGSTQHHEITAIPSTVQAIATSRTSEPASTPGEELFAKVRELIESITEPKTDAEIANDLRISKSQAKAWLQRLVEEGVLERSGRPIRYRKAPLVQQSAMVSMRDLKRTNA